MKKNLLKTLAALLVIVLAFSSVHLLLDYHYADSITSIKRFYQQKENTVDVLALGTSHVYEGLSPAVLYREYGIAAYDLCAPAQAVWNTYHYFVEALKTQTPKAVIFDVYMLNTNVHFDTTANAIKTTYGMKWSKNRIEAMRASFQEDTLEGMWLGLNQYHSRYAELTEQDILPYNGDEMYYGPSYKGFVTYDNVAEIKKNDISTYEATRTLDGKHELYYRMIIELAISREIPIYIVSIPYQIATDTQRTVNAAKAIAAEYDRNYVKFIDFNRLSEDIGLDYAQDFSGAQHLNTAGSIKFTSYFGNILKRQLSLPDRRGEPGYESWEENAEIFYRLRTKSVLNRISELGEYANAVNSLDGQYLVVLMENTPVTDETIRRLSQSEEDGNLDQTKRSFSLALLEQLFHVTKGDVQGSVWIRQPDGSFSLLGYAADGYEYYRELGAKDNLFLSVEKTKTDDGVYVSGRLGFNRNNIAYTNNGLCIFVYDMYTQRFVDCVAFDSYGSEAKRSK